MFVVSVILALIVIGVVAWMTTRQNAETDTAIELPPSDDDGLCTIHYTSAKNETTTRNIYIHGLKTNNNGDWLISATDVAAGQIKSFRVDRIVGLNYNGKTWTKQSDILQVAKALRVDRFAV